jgi:NADPH:quinone reductase-like Zn-dependent oxidoreductase
MRAICVSEFGPPSVLVPADVATPSAGPGQLLIEVTGAGVGPWDVKMRAGQFGPQDFPYIPGGEVSGLVTALGDASTPFSMGEPVYGRTGFTGGYAEYAVVDGGEVCVAPDGIDLEAAGAVPIAASTALEGIDDELHLAGGDSVLVAGAAGGVGLFVVQIAKARGARVVATASPANEEFVRSFGADEVLDYHGDWVERARGVDAAFDCVGGATWDGCVQAVRDGGRAVTINFSDPPIGRDGVTVSGFHATVTTARLGRLSGLITDGSVRVAIRERIPLDEAARAHEMVESGHMRGKLVLIPG